ncbi:hypothetical protein [Pseudomonas sp. Irchel 3H7]|uniref:hypothetical protein n=1 Tax=Pseudomonas sp. Irchel 3H7 TaxID=2009042 RepID=UPI000BA32B19|nr:hypothetical protein [Pseudomonas sp. Irchel 3H7]
MASWKWVAGVGTAAVGIIAAPVADSLVKEGKFPDGLGAVASTLWGWFSTALTAHVSAPLWATILALLLVGISLRGVIMAKRQAPEGGETMPDAAQLKQDLNRLTEQHADLQITNQQLQTQLEAETEMRKSQQSTNAALEVEIVSQRDANSDLKQQLAAKLKTPANNEVELPAFASKVLSIIAGLVNHRVTPTLLLISSSGPGQIKAEGAIDILLEHQMIVPTDGIGGVAFNLTPKGRAYFLKQDGEEKR